MRKGAKKSSASQRAAAPASESDQPSEDATVAPPQAAYDGRTDAVGPNTKRAKASRRAVEPPEPEFFEDERNLMDNMEANLTHQDEEFEAEYVLLDLNSVLGNLDIRPNAPYVLSGLDTLNPMLVIDNKFKLIGHYVETIGTCIAFNEEENEEGNISMEGCSAASVDPVPTQQVKPIASMTKILKFRPFIDSETGDRPSGK